MSPALAKTMSYRDLLVTSNDEQDAITKYLRYYTHGLKTGIVIAIEGSSHLKSGVGKSYTSIRIGERMDRDYLEGTTAMEKIAFTPRDYVRAMQYLEEHRNRYGQVISVDEAGILVNAKKWYTFFNRAMADTIFTFRELKGIANFVTPSLGNIDRDIRLFTSHLITCSKFIAETGKNLVIARFYRNFWDRSGKLYTYKIKMYWKKYKRVVRIRHFVVRYPQNKELLEEYEKKMRKFKSRVREGVLALEKIEKGFSEYVKDILEKKEIIRRHRRTGKPIVYAEEIQEYYGIPYRKALMVARRVNEKLEEMEVVGNAPTKG